MVKVPKPYVISTESRSYLSLSILHLTNSPLVKLVKSKLEKKGNVRVYFPTAAIGLVYTCVAMCVWGSGMGKKRQMTNSFRLSLWSSV